MLRAQGGGRIVDALSAGFVDATRITLVVAAVFLVLGMVGGLRVRAVAQHPAP
jgi:hypothetical protein